MLLSPPQLEDLRTNGFIVVKDVLSSDEVEQLRRATIDFFTNENNPIIYIFSGKTKSNAMSAIPGLRFLLKHPKVSRLMKDICGEQVHYAHHSDAHYNMLSGWHKDNYGDDDWATGPEGEKYGAYKMAFYLQDHTNNNYGLTIRKGSHLSRELNKGDVMDLHSKPGDAVIFDMRISHIGKEPDFFEKIIKFIFRNPKTQANIFERYRKMFGVPDKISVFFGFGAPNRFTQEHIDKTIARQNKQNKTSSYSIDKETAGNLESAGIGY
jgi:hypothetical protein